MSEALGSPREDSRAINSEESSFQIGKRTAVTFVHATPENSDEILHERSVVLVPGFAEYAEGAFRLPAEELAKRGYDIWAFSEPASREDLSDTFLIQERARMMEAAHLRYRARRPKKSLKIIERLLNEKNIPLALFREAYVLISFIEDVVQQNGSSAAIDAVSHSKGTAATLIAALLRPDLFKRIVFSSPVGRFKTTAWFGLIPGYLLKSIFWQNLLRLSRTTDEQSDMLKKVTADIRKYAEERPERGVVFLPKELGDFWGNIGFPLPWPWKPGEAVAETREMATFDANSFLMALTMHCPDIEKVTVYDADDGIIHAKEIERSIRRKGKTNLGSHIKTEAFGHFGIATDPRYAREFIDKALRMDV